MRAYDNEGASVEKFPAFDMGDVVIVTVGDDMAVFLYHALIAVQYAEESEHICGPREIARNLAEAVGHCPDVVEFDVDPEDLEEWCWRDVMNYLAEERE